MLVVGLVGVTPGEAVSFVLADRDREQAIRIGKRSIIEEHFGSEWRLKDASGQTLVVMTPWPEYRSLDLARLAASMRRPFVFDPGAFLDAAAAEEAGIVREVVGVTASPGGAG